MDTRERRLIVEGSPCDTNYFDKSLLTFADAQERGRQMCANYEECQRKPMDCALRYGLEVAKYVTKGSTLEAELAEFSQAPFLDNLFWDSENRMEFIKLNGKARFLKAVERFARSVLLMDENVHVLPHCNSCDGVKLTTTVYDSIHDGLQELSGSGKTKPRVVQYCPECEQEPRGQIIPVNPLDEIVEDMKIFSGE
ncbi:hypothetical protein HYW74_00360 [Candidatus Pacearchaeota archaeon]|nr:hypothetical protein [Candidatus Pacearchaeota archaeon]